MADKKEETAVATVEIKEEVKAPEAPTEAEAKEVLTPQELEMAKVHGLVKEEKKEETKKEEDKKPEAKAEDKKPEVKDKEEAERSLKEFKAGKELAPETEHEMLKSFNKNEIGLYFKMKEDRRKRQEAQKENEALALKIDNLTKEIEELKKPKTEEVIEDTGNDEELVNNKKLKETLSKLEKAKEEKAKADLKTIEEKEKRRQDAAKELRQRWDAMEAEAKAKDPKFDVVMQLATEMCEKDKTKTYGKIMAEAATNPNPEEGEDVISKAYALARLHPDYKTKCEETKEDGDKTDPKTIERILANQQKKTSANLTGGGGRFVTEDEITLEMAARMSDAEYARLSQKTRDRLMAE